MSCGFIVVRCANLMSRKVRSAAKEAFLLIFLPALKSDAYYEFMYVIYTFMLSNSFLKIRISELSFKVRLCVLADIFLCVFLKIL